MKNKDAENYFRISHHRFKSVDRNINLDPPKPDRRQKTEPRGGGSYYMAMGDDELDDVGFS